MYNSELVANMRSHCEHTNNKKNTALYERLRSGDATAREKLICDNMPLVLMVVNEFIDDCPRREYLRDDLMGDGFLALTKTVNNLERDRTPVLHMTAYLVATIRHALYKAHELTDEELPDNCEAVSMYEAPDTLDLLNACCLTNLDTTVLSLRQRGYSLRSISTKLSITRHIARRTLTCISERFEQRKKNLL